MNERVVVSPEMFGAQELATANIPAALFNRQTHRANLTKIGNVIAAERGKDYTRRQRRAAAREFSRVSYQAGRRVEVINGKLSLVENAPVMGAAV